MTRLSACESFVNRSEEELIFREGRAPYFCPGLLSKALTTGRRRGDGRGVLGMRPGARHLPAHLAMCRKDQLMGSGTPEWRFSHAPSRRAEIGQREGSTTHALSRTPVCLSVCVISLCPPSMGSLDCCPRGDTPLCRAGLCPFSCPTCGSEASGAPSPQSSAKKQCPLVGLAGAAPTPVRLRKDKPRAPALLPRTSDVPLGLERFPAV